MWPFRLAKGAWRFVPRWLGILNLQGRPAPARRPRTRYPADGMNEEYQGMTWNERLVHAGLLDAWDRAAKRRDRGDMVRILKCVETHVGDAEKTIEIVLTDPRKFGF